MLPPEEHKDHHSEDSPSSLKNKEICPYYRPSDRDEETEAQITTDGTDIHNYLEVRCNDTYLNQAADRPGGPCTITDPDTLASYHRVAQTPELKAMGEWCMDAIDKVVLPHAEALDLDGLNWHLERRVHTPFATCYGRADVIIENGSEAHIVDYKTGFNDQGDAEDNLQGWAYALGLLNESQDITKVTVWFLYPRINNITMAEFDRETAWPMFTKRIGQVVGDAIEARRVRAGEDIISPPAYNVDPNNCTYCAGCGNCPGWTNEVTSIMKSPPPAAPSADNVLARPSTWDLQELASMPEEMAKVITIMDGLDDYRKAARAMALMMANEKDLEIPGFKLVQSAGRATIINPVEVFKGMPPQEVAEIATISASKLAKQVARKSGTTEKEAKQQLVDQHITSPGMPFPQLRKAPKPRATLKK